MFSSRVTPAYHWVKDIGNEKKHNWKILGAFVQCSYQITCRNSNSSKKNLPLLGKFFKPRKTTQNALKLNDIKMYPIVFIVQCSFYDTIQNIHEHIFLENIFLASFDTRL